MTCAFVSTLIFTRKIFEIDLRSCMTESRLDDHFSDVYKESDLLKKKIDFDELITDYAAIKSRKRTRLN